MLHFKSADFFGTELDVETCYGSCRSTRLLRKEHGYGFSVALTRIDAGSTTEICYDNHFEACYCIEGYGEVVAAGETYSISPGVLYAPAQGERHTVTATTNLVLVSVFRPALVGHESHDAGGSYD
mgnify:CR=1 FL=1